jgi:hypothetical protein
MNVRFLTGFLFRKICSKAEKVVFAEFKQHVNKFVGISDVAKELNFPHCK